MPADDPKSAHLSWLQQAGHRADDELDLFEAGLHLAALDLPEADLGRYRDHMAEMSGMVSPVAGMAHTPDLAVSYLNEAFFTAQGYRGDVQGYDDPKNANLMHVMDRRRGIPVSLGILYICLARGQGWLAEGINFPAHFLVRLEVDGAAVLADVFSGGKVLRRAEIKELLKGLKSKQVALEPQHYEVCRDRDMLIRLLANIRIRAARAGNHRRAWEITERILALSPHDPEVLRERAMMLAREGRVHEAMQLLEGLLARNTEPDHTQTVNLLQLLTRKLH